ncbi:MAG: DUF6089 family protein, partial [Spirosomaceae bacterium]|nr:DUF6089 family protein [Spirosomataceae bacterium]
FTISTFFTLNAQLFEIGVVVGVTHYKGELYPSFKPFAPNGGANAFVRFNMIKSGISVKATGMIGVLSADDSRVNSLFHQNRGLQFRTNIWEAGGQIEYNFLHFRSTHIRDSDWTPYVFGGFNIFTVGKRTFSVESPANSPLVAYNNTTNEASRGSAIPFGIGVKKIIRPRLNLTVEFGARKIMGSNNSDIVIDNIGYVAAANSADKSVVPNFGEDANSPFLELRRFATPNNRTQDMYFYTNVSVSYLFGDVICPPGYRVPLFKRIFN